MKVKPCPFCGKMPKIDTSQWKHIEHQFEPIEVVEQRVIIDCYECFLHTDIVGTSVALTTLDEKTYRWIAKKSVENVLRNVWNRRAK